MVSPFFTSYKHRSNRPEIISGTAAYRTFPLRLAKERQSAFFRSPLFGVQPRRQAWKRSTQASNFWGACAFFQTPAAYLLASAKVG